MFQCLSGYGSSTFSTTGSLIPVTAGIAYDFRIPDTKFKVGADVYGGYGFANFEEKVNYDFGQYGSGSYDVPMTGGCFVIDSSLRASYAISSSISAGLNVGYRQAKVTKLTFAKDIDSTDKKGDTVKEDENKDYHLDFSGMTAGASFIYNF